MGKQLSKYTYTGAPMDSDMGLSRLSLLVRVISREQLESLWNSRKSLEEMGRELEIASRDVGELVKYYELSPRLRPALIGPKPMQLDALATRLWELIEYKLDEKILQKLEEFTKGERVST